MANKVIMPKAGMAMETGKIVRWLKEVGETVEFGEPLLEIETDKVNMEVEAMNSGTLLAILHDEGEEIPVVQTIGYIGESGEKVPSSDETKEVEKELPQNTQTKEQEKKTVLNVNENKIPATPAARRIAKELGICLSDVVPSGSYGQIKAQDVRNADLQPKATPLAKAIASKNGIELSGVEGTGYMNKVTKKDVLSKLHSSEEVVSIQDKLVPLSGMRKVIAKRMLSSHTEIPPVTQNTIADVTKLTEFRKDLITAIGEKISFNDLVIMAVAKTLREQPNINSQYTEEGIIQKGEVNVGIAVALEEGLIVPVIKNADTLGVKDVAKTAKDLAVRARDGKLAPDEYTGGTFTISNVGMMGVTAFTPIINQPESAILGVCAIEQRLEMDDSGNISKRLKMPICLTYDHRSIDGGQAAIFSNRIVELLENPMMLLT